jgi:hypothetical protein
VLQRGVFFQNLPSLLSAVHRHRPPNGESPHKGGVSLGVQSTAWECVLERRPGLELQIAGIGS